MNRLKKLAEKKELSSKEKKEFEKLFLEQENEYRSVTTKVLYSNFPEMQILLKGDQRWATITDKEFLEENNYILVLYDRMDVIQDLHNFLAIGLHEIGHHTGETTSQAPYIKRISNELQEKLAIQSSLADKMAIELIINPFEDVRTDYIMTAEVNSFYSWTREAMIKKKENFNRSEKEKEINIPRILIQKYLEFYKLQKYSKLNKKEREIYRNFKDFKPQKYISTDELAKAIYKEVLPHIINYLKDEIEKHKEHIERSKVIKKMIEEMNKLKTFRMKEIEKPQEKSKTQKKIPSFVGGKSELSPGEGTMECTCYYLDNEAEIKPKTKKIKFIHEKFYKNHYDEIKNQIHTMRYNIRNILIDNARKRNIPNQRKGNIEYNRAYKVKTLSTKIFQKEELLDKKDYCFGLLIDESGSMNGEKIHQAVNSAVLLEDALSWNKIPTIIGGFSDHLYIYRHFSEKNFNRNIICSGIEVADYHSDNSIFGNPQYNSDSWAVWMMSQLIAERKEKVKVMIVLTDGIPEPCSPYICIDKFNDRDIRLKKNVDEIELNNIFVVGVGIKHNSVNRYYKHHIKISDTNELKYGIIQILGKLIRKRVN